jgi:hypothetical protein
LPAAHPPVRRWWTFEGKRYATLRGSLAGHWIDVLHLVRVLERTFNPRLRLSDRPDGVVDWGQTLARGPQAIRQEYVVTSSGVGLGDEERATLQGWIAWIAKEWSEYCAAVHIESHVNWGDAPTRAGATAAVDQLRRWAHVARRSRWPLLRDVVAESLRPVLEPEDIDRIPLPSDRTKLFELLCLVRFAKELAPSPRDLRWIDPDMTGNRLRLEGVTGWYQQPLDRDDVLATPSYADGLAAATVPFSLRIPRWIDIAFDFDHPRGGFQGILVEAKSGTQTYDAAVHQLRVYREARPRRAAGRFVVWGIVEKPPGGPVSPDQLKHLAGQASADADLWVFSGSESIRPILHTILENNLQATPRRGDTLGGVTPDEGASGP